MLSRCKAYVCESVCMFVCTCVSSSLFRLFLFHSLTHAMQTCTSGEELGSAAGAIKVPTVTQCLLALFPTLRCQENAHVAFPRHTHTLSLCLSVCLPLSHSLCLYVSPSLFLIECTQLTFTDSPGIHLHGEPGAYPTGFGSDVRPFSSATGED